MARPAQFTSQGILEATSDLAAGGRSPGKAGLAAALYTPRWVRSHPVPARLLLLHRRDDFVPGGWPAEVVDRASAVEGQGEAAIRSFARRALGSTRAAAIRRVRHAFVDLPHAAVIPHLRTGEPPPPIVEELVADAYLAVIPADGA